MSDDSSGETWGILAEYDSPRALFHACEQVRDGGYSSWDAYTPFPVHGLDGAMGLKRSKLPYFVFFAGITGAIIAFLGQWWVHEVRYPLVYAAKPFFSWPAFIPVTFEVMVLFSAGAVLITLLGMCKLPQHYHPLFNSTRFERVTDDKFFVAIECADPKYDKDGTWKLLEHTGAQHIELVEDCDEEA
ncbi:MAG: hypothetical protein ACI9WU_001675 [Myxococcota bacterium]|jgi:hypothetical protein